MTDPQHRPSSGGKKDESRARILIVDDDPLLLRYLEKMLERRHIDCVCVESAEQAIELVLDDAFDVVMVDKNLPGMSGLGLLRWIRTHDENLDVIIMTAFADMDSVMRAVDAGAYDYLIKPFRRFDDVYKKIQRALDKRQIWRENQRLVENLKKANRRIESMNRNLEIEVQIRTEELREANNQLKELSLTDDVSGLYNQRFLYNRLEEEIRRHARYRDGLALVIFDLDHFKRVNDDHDHVFGSIVLKNVAAILKETVRVTDLCIRYGGDEFVAILPHTGLEEALQVAERMREAIAAENVGTATEGEYYVTASFGVAALEGNAVATPEELLRMADKALYDAKAEGRNKVISSTKPVAKAS